MPHLEDENFQRSVVYICENTEQGSMGLVLTQATDLSIAELCAKMNFMMADEHEYSDKLVLLGGPVEFRAWFYFT